MAGQSKLAVPGTYDCAVNITKAARFFVRAPGFSKPDTNNAQSTHGACG